MSTSPQETPKVQYRDVVSPTVGNQLREKRYRSLVHWRSSHFTLFWVGQSLSFMGDGFAFIALPLLVLQATGSVAQMGGVTATMGVGQLLAGLFSGQIVDRVNRRRLMIVCDCGRLLLYLAIPLSWWLWKPSLALIYGVTILASVLSNVFDVASTTIVPNLVEKERITAANGRLRMAMSLSFLVGPAVAGLVCKQFGPATAMGIDAVSFGFSALTLIFIRLRRLAPELVQNRSRLNFLNDLSTGIRFVWNEPTLRVMLLFLVPLIIAEQSTNNLMIYYFKHNLFWNDTSVGIFFGASSIGALLGGLLANTLRHRFGFGFCYLGGLLLIGMGMVLIMVAPAFLLLYVLLDIGIVFGYSVNSIGSLSLRQEITPDWLMGRVSAVFMTAAMALGPIGALLSTAIAVWVGAVPVLIGLGAILVALSLLGVFTPAARRHPEQEVMVER